MEAEDHGDLNWKQVCEDAVGEMLVGSFRYGACGAAIPLSTSDEAKARERAVWLRGADFVSAGWTLAADPELDPTDDPVQYRLAIRLPRQTSGRSGPKNPDRLARGRDS